MAGEQKSEAFHLQEESSAFSARSKDVFGSLDILEKKHENIQKVLNTKLGSSREQRGLWKADPEEETIIANKSPFKRPFDRPQSTRGLKYRKRGRSPDFKVNPEKWTKYSLEDVKSGDLSESSNARAAFAFLEERQKLREAEENKIRDDNDGSESSGKILFKKPSKILKTSIQDSSPTKNRRYNRGKGNVGVVIEHLDEPADDGVSETVRHAETVELDERSSGQGTAKVSFKKGKKNRSNRSNMGQDAEDVIKERQTDTT